MFKQSSRFQQELNDLAPTFVRQVLIFPVLVVLIAAVTFLFGGHCAFWQWWGAFAIIIAPTFRFGVSRGLKSTGLFLTWLYAVRVMTSVLVTPGWPDIVQYHLPAVRLLVEGWNPITMATPEALQSFSGIDNSLMRHMFVLFMAKGCWYFCAVAFFFTHEPLNLLFPLFPFLFLPVAIQVCRLFHGPGAVFWRFLGILLLVGVVIRFYPERVCYSAIVDCAVCLGGVGLFLSMHGFLSRGEWRWPELLCNSFWMCVAKQTGMASCFAFWFVFALVLLVWLRKKAIRRLWFVFISLFAMVLLTGVSPYVTSTIKYGHPLYPHSSGNEALHPTMDFNAPQKLRNADADAMGYWGNFITAYVSPTMACSYYKWKLSQHDFKPRCYHWGGRDAPTSLVFRFGLLALTLFLLVTGGCAERIVVCMCWAGIAAFPPYLMGDSRFIPWAFGLVFPALVVVSAWKRLWVRRLAFSSCALYSLLFIVPKALFHGAYLLDASQVVRDEACMAQIRNLYIPYVPTCGQLPPPSWTYTEWNKGNVLLLKRMSPGLCDKKVIMVKLEREDDPKAQDFRPFCDYSFWVASSDVDLTSFSEYWRIAGIADRRKRLEAFPGFIVHAYCVTLPKLAVKALF